MFGLPQLTPVDLRLRFWAPREGLSMTDPGLALTEMSEAFAYKPV
jgi:hypothetical protein